jgi:hypothetical protein
MSPAQYATFLTKLRKRSAEFIDEEINRLRIVG